MEVEKTKEELLAFLEMNSHNSTAGLALREFISANIKVNDDSSEESSEIEETIEDVREEGRDDEDFIIMELNPPLNKKKEKKLIIKNVSSAKSKRKCEFCGTLETPMWRRGPTGKGTLCNACGVKWSLKFRKRAGKKVNKPEKIRDEPREQRLSTRKKIPSKKSTDSSPSAVGPISDHHFEHHNNVHNVFHSEAKEESSTHQHIGLCCNHSSSSSKKRRSAEDNNISGEETTKRRKDNANLEYDSLSDTSPHSSYQLLGKLLNVVEVQLVEEEELDRVKKQMRQLRNDLETGEANRERLFAESKDNAIHELSDLKKNVLTTYNQEKEEIVSQCGLIMDELASKIKNHLEEVRKALGGSTSEEISTQLSYVSNEMESMRSKFASICEKKLPNEYSPIEKIFIAREQQLGNKYNAFQGEMEHNFTEMNQRLEMIEDPIMRTP